MLEGQIDGRGEREGLPKEILFEGEMVLLKKIHDLKKRLGTEGCSEREPPSVTQTSFLRTDLGEDEVSFKFE